MIGDGIKDTLNQVIDFKVVWKNEIESKNGVGGVIQLHNLTHKY